MATNASGGSSRGAGNRGSVLGARSRQPVLSIASGGWPLASVGPGPQSAQRADASAADEAHEPPRLPERTGLGRKRAQEKRLVAAERLAGELHRIVVEGVDLVGAHAVALEP